MGGTMRAGADTIVKQCLNIQPSEFVAVVSDGYEPQLVEVLLAALREHTDTVAHVTYPEPESHGAEPPAHVADIMAQSDVFIAPTAKSITHTQARVNACNQGARGVTMPGITEEIWSTSLQADYYRVKEIAETVYTALEDTDVIHITTPSGTDLTIDVNMEYFHTDTGIVHEPGAFGNLPAGEADGGVQNADGTLVVDHFPFAPSGTTVTIENGDAVDIQHPNKKSSELADAFDTVPGARNVAEFGFGTNPEATLIGNVLQDEKVLGTVHVAFGDNASYIPDSDANQVQSDIHWDTVCEQPTVRFDDRIMLEKGEPVFLNE